VDIPKLTLLLQFSVSWETLFCSVLSNEEEGCL
ncbi:hypothetical protein CCACVL1_01977, partial [Corchorus capsularis]